MSDRWIGPGAVLTMLLVITMPASGQTTPATSKGQAGQRSSGVVPAADPAAKALAGKLAAEFRERGVFDTSLDERPEAVAALGYLALTAQEAMLVALAYESMARPLERLIQEDKMAPDLAVEAIAAGLRRSERLVLGRAIQVAPILSSGSQAHEASLRALAELARKDADADVRRAALNALGYGSARALGKNDIVAESLVQALDDTNEGIVALDLWMVGQIGPLLPPIQEPARRARLVAGLERLRRGQSGVLRAAAIAPSLKFHPGIEIPLMGLPAERNAATRQFATEMMERLGDAAAPVRGNAAMALGVLRYGEAVPRIVPLLDDGAQANAIVGGIRSLVTGEPEESYVNVIDLGGPTVGMAALGALRLIAQVEETDRSRWIQCDDPSAEFAACAQRARQWAARRR
jgi:hypothetical protein